MNYDIIVIGAGTAGIPCAVEAASRGKRTLLLEKAGDIGGTLHVSGGHMSGAGTRRQHEKGIEDSIDAHIEDINRISHGSARPDLSRRAAEVGPITIDWLEGLGFEFAPETPRLVYGHEPYSTARTYYGVDQGRSILKVFRKILDAQIEQGNLDIKLNARVNDLITENETVIGVRLENDEEFFSPVVVIATGGFGANGEIFSRLEGAPLVSASWPTATGDGLLMAERLGAHIAGAGTYLPTFGGLPSPDGTGFVRWSDRPLLIAKERPPYEIYVDRNGKRWVAEDEESIDVKEHALVEIPEMTFWTVFDEVGMQESFPMVIGWERDDFRAKANNLPGVFSAETLPELAARMGVDPQGLVATIAEYNSAVAHGKDEKFGRKFLPAPIQVGPFYGLQNHAVTLITFSGIDVDSEFRVRKSDGSVIPGLFAVGEALGAAATMGKSFCGGLLAMPAIGFARLIAQAI